MGRFLKNQQLKSAGYGLVLTQGPTALRPVYPVDGEMRFNTDLNQMEMYYDSRWNSFARIGKAVVDKDTFLGDGITSAFTMTRSYSGAEENRIIAVVGNVFQNPGVAFTVSGFVITFTSPPPLGQTAIVLHGFASTDAATS